MSVQGRVPADAAPTLRLRDLPEIERRVIRLLRLWRDGPAGRSAARILAGAAVCLRLDDLLRLLAAPGARPLHIGPPGAGAVLGDEGVLARVVSIALEGGREEAALTCGLVAPAATAREASRLSGELGHAMLAAPAAARAYLIAGRPVTPRGAGGR
jgi:hypothetical protein